MKQDLPQQLQQHLLTSITDLTALLTNRPIALILITLLLYKVYTLAPETLVYTMASLLLTALFVTRWVLHYIAQKSIEYAQLHNTLKQPGSIKDKPDDQP